jgi:hypothetical protein
VGFARAAAEDALDESYTPPARRDIVLMSSPSD